MVALGCLAGSEPEVQWATKRKGGRLEVKAEMGFRKELRGPVHTHRWSPQRIGDAIGRGDPASRLQ